MTNIMVRSENFLFISLDWSWGHQSSVWILYRQENFRGAQEYGVSEDHDKYDHKSIGANRLSYLIYFQRFPKTFIRTNCKVVRWKSENFKCLEYNNTDDYSFYCNVSFLLLDSPWVRQLCILNLHLLFWLIEERVRWCSKHNYHDDDRAFDKKISSVWLD